MFTIKQATQLFIGPNYYWRSYVRNKLHEQHFWKIFHKFRNNFGNKFMNAFF